MVKLWLLCLLGFTELFASVEVIEVSSLEKLHDRVLADRPRYLNIEPLIVYDIDETLLEVEDCLTSDETGFKRWIKKIRQCPSQTMEHGIPFWVQSLQKKDIPTIVLTARGHVLQKATERELNRHQITFKDRPYGEATNFEMAMTQRTKIVFENGVLYASGRKKSEALKLFMEETRDFYSLIYFIDNDVKNIRDLTKAFETDSSLHLVLFHYFPEE